MPTPTAPFVTLAALALATSSAAQACTSQVDGCVCQTGTVTQQQYDDMYQTLAEHVRASRMRRRDQRPEDFVGAVVRLSFHDAGEFVDGAPDDFRSDGCVHMGNPDNRGLEQVIGQLDMMWRQHCSIVSRADFWVLAAKVAIEESGTPNGYTLPFRFGRIDAATCTYNNPRLPNSQLGLDEIERVFVTQMKLELRDAVALMGAHTLGRMEEENSGYEGPWVRGNNAATFNNQYYRGLISRPWRRTDNGESPADGSPLEQWEAGRELMLNTDMSMAFEIGADGANAGANNNRCGGRQLLRAVLGPRPRGCALSSTFNDVHEFARNNTAFLAAFATAFEKMTQVGYDSSTFHDAGDTVVANPTRANSSPVASTVASSPGTNSPPTTSTTTSQAVTDGSDVCADDATWKDNNGRGCIWVTNNRNRCNARGINGRRAWLACPEACGACANARCGDDPNFRVRVGRQQRSCLWLRRNRRAADRNCSRRGTGGIPAHTACPEACSGFIPASCDTA